MATARESNSGSEENISDQNQDSDFSGFISNEALINARVLGQVTMEQVANDRILPIDEINGWERNDSPPINTLFSGIPGLNNQNKTRTDYLYK